MRSASHGCRVHRSRRLTAFWLRARGSGAGGRPTGHLSDDAALEHLLTKPNWHPDLTVQDPVDDDQWDSLDSRLRIGGPLPERWVRERAVELEAVELTVGRTTYDRLGQGVPGEDLELVGISAGEEHLQAADLDCLHGDVDADEGERADRLGAVRAPKLLDRTEEQMACAAARVDDPLARRRPGDLPHHRGHVHRRVVLTTSALRRAAPCRHVDLAEELCTPSEAATGGGGLAGELLRRHDGGAQNLSLDPFEEVVMVEDLAWPAPATGVHGSLEAAAEVLVGGACDLLPVVARGRGGPLPLGL